MIGFLIAWIAAFVGFSKARGFVKNRLRYVDGVHKRSAPWKAGLIAAVVTTPIALILPFISGASAMLFGASIGLGVAAGRRDLRRRLPALS